MIASILSFLTGGLVDKIVGLGEAYFNKEISEAEFQSRVDIAVQETAAKITESQQATIRSSPVLQRVVAFVGISQTLVLLLHQVGAPLWPMITGQPFPAPVVTIDLAYGLVGVVIGANWLARR